MDMHSTVLPVNAPIFCTARCPLLTIPLMRAYAEHTYSYPHPPPTTHMRMAQLDFSQVRHRIGDRPWHSTPTHPTTRTHPPTTPAHGPFAFQYATALLPPWSKHTY